MQALDANPVTLPMEPGDVLALISDGILEQHDAAGAMFGEERALEVLRTHHRGSMQELSARLFDAVAVFAGGVTQEDDMTVVLLRRDAATVARRAFERRIGSLGEIVAFTRERFAAARIDPGALPATDFAIEELFTNMLKYGNPRATVTLEIAAIDHGVEVTIVEDDADRFDPRGARAVDVAAPIGEREPGGLGLHVLRRMVDSLEYRYLEDKRQGRTTFRKTLPGAKGDATNARD
jgi:anti-sigma regulatory factor (Ser/Thr protein kinase)